MSNKLGTCKFTGKHQHKSRGAANAHLRAMFKLEDSLEDPEKLNVYPCKKCSYWHVGRGKFTGPVQIIPPLPKLRRGPGLKYKKD